MLKLPYQKLLIWQKAMALAKTAYIATKDFPKNEEYELTRQIKTSASSIPANIAEGSQRGTNKDFSNFISIARGSLAELETHFLLANQLEFLPNEFLEEIMNKTTELSKMLHAFQRTLTTSH